MTQASIEQPDAELRERYEEFRREHKDDKLGEIATRVLHEDETVKIWDMSLAPGEATDLHTHENDYVLVMLQGDRVAGISKDGSEDIVIDLTPGPDILRIDKGMTEWAYNLGKEPFYEILIELKK